MQTLQVYTVEVFEEKEDSDIYNKKFKSIFIIFLFCIRIVLLFVETKLMHKFR